jgi:amino acid adenylation domain-containing protein
MDDISRSPALHHTFSRRAKENPSAHALIHDGRVVTYGELDKISDRWAGRLSELGVGPGHIVPIFLPRGADLIAGMLGALKAGAAFALPDRTWSADDWANFSDIRNSPVAVTSRIDPAIPNRVILTPDNVPATASALRVLAGAETNGDSPCCVFFTSGTTGRSKSVLVPHIALSRLVCGEQFVPFGRNTRMPLAAASAWDAFALELWAPLLNGGACIIIDEPYLSSQALRGAIVAKANVVWLTSSLFNLIVDEDLEAFAGLERVITGGERLSTRHVSRFLERHASIELINGYGPVESTVFATTHVVILSDCERPNGIPIGRPVQGTGIHVLSHERRCLPGEPGEIYISGCGLAIGYLGDPALDAARFSLLDVGDGCRVRAFRTGDSGFFDEQGTLHFLGRVDRQIKLRGVRLDLVAIESEIEARLAEVKGCRLVAQIDADGQVDALVAFCTAVPGQTIHPDSLQMLRKAMSHHAWPSRLIQVQSFPMTANGKLDERSLLALVDIKERARAPDRRNIEAVTLEGIVVEIFSEVLGRRSTPPDESLFDLGGTSLDAGRICARLARCLGYSVPVSLLYRFPIANDLARELAKGVDGFDRDRHGVISPVQLGFLIRHIVEPYDLTMHCLLCWTLNSALDMQALEAAIDAVHCMHPALRSVFFLDPVPGVRLGDFPSPGLSVQPEVSSLEDAHKALIAALTEPLDPTTGRIWRVVLVPIANIQAAAFGCVVHHIAFDGASESILTASISEAYTAHCRGKNRSVDVGWIRLANVTSSLTPAEIADLSAELARVAPLAWPTPSPAPRLEGIGHITRLMPPQIVNEIDRIAARSGLSRFVVLLACWGSALLKLSGHDEVVIGVPVNLRAGTEYEQAIGCHIGMAPVRLRARNHTTARNTFLSTAAAFHEAFLAASSALIPPSGEAGLSDRRRPFPYQVLFVLQDSAEPVLALDDARAIFVRPAYVALPLELHTEIWQEKNGAVTAVTSYRRAEISHAAAIAVTDLFHDELVSITQVALQS